ncbi:MAG: 2-C-methyl-D-erythritol 2,4-cyclodiphosphate synthase [Thermoguttaceae bacterium]
MLRVGIGHDTHQLTEGNGIVLGGVRISFHRSLLGHSDADVLLHAVIDALLGAAGLGDIGEMFSNTDPNNRGRCSGEMLQIAWQKVKANGWNIVNLDAIIFAEKPKITPYKEQMRNQIASLLSILPSQIGLKAKTGENVGPIGRQEAISAECVVLLTSAQDQTPPS